MLRKLYVIFLAAVLGLSVVCISHQFLHHWYSLSKDGSCEPREGSIPAFTELMVQGKNPTRLEYQPMYYNTYGVLYPLAVLPFAKIFSPSLKVHRAVAAVFLWLALGIVGVAIALKSRRFKAAAVSLGVVGVALYYYQLQPSMIVCANQNSMGLFFFLLAVLVPWIYDFSKKSLLAGVTLGVIGSMVKLYFGWSVFLLLIYSFISRPFRDSLRLAIQATAMVFAVYLAMFLFQDNYFAMNVVRWIGFLPSNPRFIKDQLELIQDRLWFEIGLLLLVLLMSGAWFLFKRKKEEWVAAIRKPFYWTVLLIFSVIFWFKVLGHNGGSQPEYFYQLILPLILIVCFRKMLELPEIAQIPLLLCLGFYIYNLASPMAFWEDGYQFAQATLEWQALRVQVQKHSTILPGTSAVPLLLESHKEIYDNGQTDFFSGSADTGILPGPLLRLQQRIDARFTQYTENVCGMVRNRKFDLIMTDADTALRWCANELLLANYKPNPELPRVCAPDCLDLWVPKVSR